MGKGLAIFNLIVRSFIVIMIIADYLWLHSNIDYRFLSFMASALVLMRTFMDLGTDDGIN